MAQQPQKKQETAPAAPAAAPIMFTVEDMNYQSDLMQKLLTLDHVKSILVGNGDAEIFIKQIKYIREIFEEDLTRFVQFKQSGGVINEGQDQQPTDEGGPAPTVPEGTDQE